MSCGATAKRPIICACLVLWFFGQRQNNFFLIEPSLCSKPAQWEWTFGCFSSPFCCCSFFCRQELKSVISLLRQNKKAKSGLLNQTVLLATQSCYNSKYSKLWAKIFLRQSHWSPYSQHQMHLRASNLSQWHVATKKNKCGIAPFSYPVFLSHVI